MHWGFAVRLLIFDRISRGRIKDDPSKAQAGITPLSAHPMLIMNTPFYNRSSFVAMGLASLPTPSFSSAVAKARGPGGFAGHRKALISSGMRREKSPLPPLRRPMSKSKKLRAGKVGLLHGWTAECRIMVWIERALFVVWGPRNLRKWLRCHSRFRGNDKKGEYLTVMIGRER